MNIYTSNFYISKPNNSQTISIAGRSPYWYDGKKLLELAPSKSLVLKYKGGYIDSQEYTRIYYEEVLNPLDPVEILEKIKQLSQNFENTFILCYENPGKFCHRRLVASWLNSQTGIGIPEWNPKTMRR